MGFSPYLLAGPLVAAIGLVAVFFVMRHRSVQTKSMYSARRGQIERKVRAARQRTLAPTGRHAEKETAAAPQEFAAPGMEGKTAIPTATWGPPPTAPAPPAPPPMQQSWDIPAAAAPAPSPPSYAPPPEPAYTPPPAPAYTPPPEPAYAPPAEEWVPAPAPPVQPRPVEPPPVEPAVSTPSGGGASWEIVGSPAPAAEPATEKKGKKAKEKETSLTGAWQLASGEAPGEASADEIKLPSAAMAIAQYAVLVVGLVMVLIGVLVMVANSHIT